MAEAKSKTAAPKAAPAAKKGKTAAAEKPVKAAAAKPAPAAKAAAKPAAKKPAAPRKTAAKPAAKSAQKLQPGPEELYRMIQTAAYFIAERNGFQGDSKNFWAQAEAQIISILK